MITGHAPIPDSRYRREPPTLKNWPIPLPPLAEQHRIVAKVNVLMALCDDLEARIRKRQEVQTKLLESVIAEMAIQA
ncbi:hypothetical protein FKB36_08670 [Methanoculleus sp. Afa-1]|uniref:Type I restriction modification DNA specificity domain-containing protein n=1 Tax=Methanoculleus formosensis TaxID=2590886 RepID=A0A9E4ZNB3_9EURY|nr:hypothetical protein [Methanoculleus sp. Afa-1]